MNIQDLKSNTTWQEASNTINNNNNKISLAIATLENATLKNKGYFTTLEKLNEAIPNPSVGSKAYVGTSEPYAIYIVENGVWVDSGHTGGDEIVAKITTDRIEDGAVTTEKIATSAFDSTLSVSGKIAPADVVGEKITELEKDTLDLGVRLDLGDVNFVKNSEPTYVLMHITARGTIAPNNNKNVTFVNPVLALKGSSFYVDNGYKYQYALYDKNTGVFIERVTWINGEEKTILNDDYLIRVEISDINESVLSDISIVSHLHQSLISHITPLNEKINDLEADYTNVSLEVDGLQTSSIDLSQFEKFNGLLSNGKWFAIYPQYQHIIVPVLPNHNYEIEANETEEGAYAFLRTYTDFVEGQPADYATGYIAEVKLPFGTNVKVSAPNNAHFIYILAKVETSNRIPSSFKSIGVVNQIVDDAIEQERQDNSNAVNEDFLSLTEQADNLVVIMGESSIIGKKMTIVSPDKYSCWSFVGKLKNRVVCVYTKALEHEDADKGAIFSRVSANGIIWTPIKGIIDTLGKRDGITGKGNDNEGNLLILNRVGYPSATGTFYEVYKTTDGFNYDKIASNIFGAGHVGDIINVPNVGLVAFFNTYGTSRSWGKLVSTDNGLTWTATTIESGLVATECPFEISAQYLGNGRILAMGRYDANTGTLALWQMQSSDYGNTWTRIATNLVYGGGNTPSLLYNETTGLLDLFVYQRGTGKLFHIQNSVESIWNNPTNWANGVIIGNGTIGQDAGNVNAVAFNGRQIISYYSGSPTETGIYAVIL